MAIPAPQRVRTLAPTHLTVLTLRAGQESYGAADLGLRYQKDTWWVDAFVRKVNDKKIKASAFNGSRPWLAQYEPPRTAGIHTGFDF